MAMIDIMGISIIVWQLVAIIGLSSYIVVRHEMFHKTQMKNQRV